jgi:hypothetical protein
LAKAHSREAHESYCRAPAAPRGSLTAHRQKRACYAFREAQCRQGETALSEKTYAQGFRGERSGRGRKQSLSGLVSDSKTEAGVCRFIVLCVLGLGGRGGLGGVESSCSVPTLRYGVGRAGRDASGQCTAPVGIDWGRGALKNYRREKSGVGFGDDRGSHLLVWSDFLCFSLD